MVTDLLKVVAEIQEAMVAANPNLAMNFNVFDVNAEVQELQKNQAYVNNLNTTTQAHSTTIASQTSSINTLNQNTQVSAVPYTAVDPSKVPNTIIQNGVTHLLLNPPATVASHAVMMPSTPVDGQNTVISTGPAGVTALTLQPNTGQSFAPGSAATTLPANSVAKYIWVASQKMWFKSG